MAERNPPYVIQGASHSGELFREASGSLIASQGIVTATDLAVTANGTPNMTVNVAVGAAWVAGTQNTFQGSYYCLNDAIKSLVITAANATNPRIDLVAVVVQDTNYGGATNTWALTVVAGTPAPSPVAPALPANALQLASIAVGAAVTSIVAGNITDSRVSYALIPPKRLAVGIQSGSAVGVVTSAGGDTSVVFPAAFATSCDQAVVTGTTTNLGLIYFAITKTTTGITVRTFSSSTGAIYANGTISYDWIVIGH